MKKGGVEISGKLVMSFMEGAPVILANQLQTRWWPQTAFETKASLIFVTIMASAAL